MSDMTPEEALKGFESYLEQLRDLRLKASVVDDIIFSQHVNPEYYDNSGFILRFFDSRIRYIKKKIEVIKDIIADPVKRETYQGLIKLLKEDYR